MQLFLTLIIVALAACYAAYELLRFFYPSRSQNSSCGHSCGGCSHNKPLQNEKGEPVTLVPLQVIRKF